jgi:hypothetical protein
MAWHVVSIGEMKNACRFWQQTLKARDNFRDLDKDKRCNEIKSERNTVGMVKPGLT